MTLFIPVLLGTSRSDSMSRHVAAFVAEVGESLAEVRTEIVDPATLNLPLDGNDEDVKDPRYTALTAEADAFFIVAPEYNHSFPGSLKRMLDSELTNYIHKPVAFCSVSAQRWGGVRATEQLVGTVRELGLVATFTDLPIPQVSKVFGPDKGDLLDERYEKYAKASWNELIWMAQTLKHGRESIPSKFHS